MATSSSLSSLLLPDDVIERTITAGRPVAQTKEERLANKQEWWRRLNWQEKCANMPKKAELMKAIEGRERKFQLDTQQAFSTKRDGIASDRSSYAKHEADTKARIRRQKDLILTWAVVPWPTDSDLPPAPPPVKKRARRSFQSDGDTDVGSDTDTEAQAVRKPRRKLRRIPHSSGDESESEKKHVRFNDSESKEEKRRVEPDDSDSMVGTSTSDMKIVVAAIGHGDECKDDGIICSECKKPIQKGERAKKSRNCGHYLHNACLTRQAAFLITRDSQLQYVGCPADGCGHRFWESARIVVSSKV